MAVCLDVLVPLVGLRPYSARDYQETYVLPPPATVFGMCLSFLGVDRDEVGAFDGTRIAVAGSAAGQVSTVLRKMRRALLPSFRPEYQELLVDLQLWVLVEHGRAQRDLAAEMRRGLSNPASIQRFGAVSLGESAFLVDSVKEVQSPECDVMVLRPSRNGALSMPVWVDFTAREQTRVRRFDIISGRLGDADLVEVGPTAGVGSTP